MTITLTDRAAARINELLAKQPDAVALRLGVTKAGCSGLAYTMDFAEEPNADDEIFEDHGIRLLVGRGELDYLDGMQVDFVREGLNQSFTFSNPNVTATCGCGESFAV